MLQYVRKEGDMEFTQRRQKRTPRTKNKFIGLACAKKLSACIMCECVCMFSLHCSVDDLFLSG